MKQVLLNNLKNAIGFRTKRKIVVFSVDDYGNVRVDSPHARENMDMEGYKALNRFDAFDTLETSQDLEYLYETLDSVRDAQGRPAVFTPFALPCNIDFERMEENGYKVYKYEKLISTYNKLESLQPDAYKGAWQLWQEGIDKGLMAPQFHGREHLNLNLLEVKLAFGDQRTLTALKNRSYASITSTGYYGISPMAAFDFWKFYESHRFHPVIREGIQAFEEVYGYRPSNFNAPSGREHSVIHKTLAEEGVRYIDTPMFKKEHQSKGKFKRKFRYTGKRNEHGQTFLVRNIVFEPTEKRNIDWVYFALQQIEAAFRWNKPANISSHRVNFCGHIDPDNRKTGLLNLRKLLQEITRRWPDVEFMTAAELGDLVAGKK